MRVMRVEFEVLARGAAVVCLALSAVWIFSPEALPALWGLEATVAANVVGRRSGILFFGLAAMVWLARGAPPSVARTALSVGLAILCFGLAVVGLLDLAAGRAGRGVWFAIAVEISMGLAFAVQARGAAGR